MKRDAFTRKLESKFPSPVMTKSFKYESLSANTVLPADDFPHFSLVELSVTGFNRANAMA